MFGYFYYSYTPPGLNLSNALPFLNDNFQPSVDRNSWESENKGFSYIPPITKFTKGGDILNYKKYHNLRQQNIYFSKPIEIYRYIQEILMPKLYWISGNLLFCFSNISMKMAKTK